MTEQEKQVREYILKQAYEYGYREMLCDKDDEITFREDKRDEYGEGRIDFLPEFLVHLFPDVSNADEEPTRIADLLGIVDWESVPKDTKVLISDDGTTWQRRYFAEYENGKFYCYRDGYTSWIAGDRPLVGWKYCKLAEDESEGHRGNLSKCEE